ncbi:MAG: hypothetical protein CMJ76_08910 [Planctomycetaceae bacterium]|nr:hypothetical protein [Planctomycetaceae bacterium]
MTRKLTIAGAFLLMVGLLATFGNADDVPATSAPAPAEIKIPHTASPIILTEKQDEASVETAEVAVDDTSSVLTIANDDSENQLLLTESDETDQVLTETVTEEPTLFDPPTQLEVGTSTEMNDAFIPDQSPTAADTLPVSSGTEPKLPQTSAPIVTPDTQGLEFQVISDEGNALSSPPGDNTLPAFDIEQPVAADGIQTRIIQSPVISVSSAGPKVIRAGETGEYVITASNGGSSTVEDLFLVTSIPDWVEIAAVTSDLGEVDQLPTADGLELQWSVGSLPAGKTAYWKIKLAPEKNRPFAMDIKWTIQPQSIINRIDVTQPELQLSIDGPEVMTYGDTEIVVVRVSNTGNGEAEDVVLKINPGIVRGQSIGALPVGASKVVELELTAEQAGVMAIQAAVSAGGVEHDKQSLDIQIERPELAVSVNGPAKKFAGNPVTYRIEIANTGDTVAKDVVVSAVLPAGAKYSDGSDNLQTGRRNLSWKIGSVAEASTRAFEFSCVLMQDGKNQLSVRVEAAAAESRTGQFSTAVTGVADLKLLVNDPPGPKMLDELAVYEIKVVNRGTKIATNIDVVGQFGHGVEPVKAEGRRADLIPGQAVFNPIESLGPGEEIVLKVYAKASKAGRHKFRAVVKSTNPETALVQEEMTWFHDTEQSADDQGPVILTADGAGQ